MTRYLVRRILRELLVALVALVVMGATYAALLLAFGRPLR